MDLNELNRNYPETFALFQEHVNSLFNFNWEYVGNKYSDILVGCFFRFLDKNKIEISIVKSITNPKFFTQIIHNGSLPEDAITHNFSTRDEAMSYAVDQAFSILEKQIEKPKKRKLIKF